MTEIRPATTADLDAIAAVEQAAFEQPWSRDSYAEELVRAVAYLDVALDGGQVVGFVCAWHVADEAHLLRVAVARGARGQGHGEALVRRVVARARQAGCARIDLEVGRGNGPALALYRRFGFVQVGERLGYYAHPPDDALLLRLDLAVND